MYIYLYIYMWQSRPRCPTSCPHHPHPARKVDIRLPGNGISNAHGARPVHQIISMIKWIRTSRSSIKNSLSLREEDRSRALATRHFAPTILTLRSTHLYFFFFITLKPRVE